MKLDIKTSFLKRAKISGIIREVVDGSGNISRTFLEGTFL
jgi:hypothetical protein